MKRIEHAMTLLAAIATTLTTLGPLTTTAAPQQVSIDEFAARSVARVAYLDLRARPLPEPDDYVITQQLLALAAEFAPEDPELVRARLRAAWAAGDREAVDRLTRRLLQLDPQDTVAQLRLISGRLDAMQTAEERTRAYDRLLGSGGASLDPAVRSRLALDAALLARERGDADGFTDKLTLAMQLDPSHKEAASLAWSYFSPFLEAPADRFEMLLNLLYADPVDPQIHERIAFEAAKAGAFEQASRFHSMATALNQRRGGPPDDRFATTGNLIAWQIEGPEAAVESLNAALAALRDDAARKIAFYESQNLPTQALMRPEDILLLPLVNQIRLVAAISAEDQATIDATVSDMARALQKRIADTEQAIRLSGEQERAQRGMQLWGEITQYVVAIAWAGVESESIIQWRDQAIQVFGEDEAISKAIDAWSELRNGDPAIALEKFEALQPQNSLTDVGRALALEAAGLNDEALSVLATVARDNTLSLSGVWARGRHQKLTGRDPMDTPDRAAVNRLAEGVPRWIDRMTVDPTVFMTLRAEFLETSIDAVEGPRLRLRLRNLAPIPLAVGGDRVLNSRFLLAPRLETGIETRIGEVRPEVVELDRRFRLKPTEAIDVVITPDPGLAGWISEAGAILTQRSRWRALQGYGITGDGIPIPGVLCLEVDTNMLVRRPLKHGRTPGPDLAAALEMASPSDLPDIIASIRARTLANPSNQWALSTDDLSRIASIAAERYPHLPPAYRAAMLSVLPSPAVAPGMAAFHQAAREETDPRLVRLLLTTTVSSPDDPLLDTWAEAEDPRLRTFVRATRTRLQSDAPTFSRLGRAALAPGGS